MPRLSDRRLGPPVHVKYRLYGAPVVAGHRFAVGVLGARVVYNECAEAFGAG